MRIICENGFYKFFGQNVAEIRRFQDKFGIELVQCDNYYTFKVLAQLPNFSFKGQPYSGSILSLVNYAGEREKVMAANGFTYDQGTDNLVEVSTFRGLKAMKYSISNFIIMDNLPQAYFYDSNGIITGFSLILDVDFMKYKIERFFYENI